MEQRIRHAGAGNLRRADGASGKHDRPADDLAGLGRDHEHRVLGVVTQSHQSLAHEELGAVVAELEA